jgi:hypothetical protein
MRRSRAVRSSRVMQKTIAASPRRRKHRNSESSDFTPEENTCHNIHCQDKHFGQHLSSYGRGPALWTHVNDSRLLALACPPGLLLFRNHPHLVVHGRFFVRAVRSANAFPSGSRLPASILRWLWANNLSIARVSCVCS